nr:DUF2062 domain-containing protein [Thiocapsa imhoffii]
MPAPKRLLASGRLGLFGALLKDPNLWHVNRHSAAGGVAVGLFVAFMPPLGQTLIAAAVAILLRVNLPITLAMSFVSNPVTIPPILYFSYSLGCWVLGLDPEHFDLEFWLDWRHWLLVIWPLTVGSAISATLMAGLGYLVVQTIWRWGLIRQLRIRRKRYQAAASTSRVSRPSSRRQT